MASIRDVPQVVRKVGFGQLLKRVWTEIGHDDVFTWSSALAYAWIFAIFPFMIFLLTLAPYLPGNAKQRVIEQVSTGAQSGLGGDAAHMVVRSVNQVMSQQQGGLLSIGLLIALWSAAGGMSMTMSALDRAYAVSCSRSFIRQRSIALALTLGTAILILLSVFLMPIGTWITTYLQKQAIIGPALVIVVNIVRYVVAIGLLMLVISMIYYFGPCIRQKWHAVTPGAVFAVIIWIAMAYGFSFYVGHFGNFNKTYGTLGAAIILLLFFYLSAVVLLIGAELNSAIDFEVLGVEDGERDFTHPATPRPGASRQPKRPAPVPQGQGFGTPMPAHAFSAGAPPRRNKWKWITAFFAARWLWKKWRRPRMA